MLTHADTCAPTCHVRHIPIDDAAGGTDDELLLDDEGGDSDEGLTAHAEADTHDGHTRSNQDRDHAPINSRPELLASPSQIIIQNGATSGFEMSFLYFYRILAPLVPGSQPKHVSNPGSVIKKYEPHLLHGWVFRLQARVHYCHAPALRSRARQKAG